MEMVRTIPHLEVKGATLPYTSLNGHMFSFLSKDGLVGIRLPEKERKEFLEKYKSTLFEAHGTIMKEYVTVPHKLLEKPKELVKYLAASLAYIKTLKPKAGKN